MSNLTDHSTLTPEQVNRLKPGDIIYTEIHPNGGEAPTGCRDNVATVQLMEFPSGGSKVDGHWNGIIIDTPFDVDYYNKWAKQGRACSGRIDCIKGIGPRPAGYCQDPLSIALSRFKKPRVRKPS